MLNWHKAFKGIALTAFLIFRVRINALEKSEKELKNKVDERTKELKDVLTDKDRLLSVVAHDLKNPMFAIVSALERWIKIEHKTNNEDKKKYIEEIYDSAEYLQKEMIKLLEWASSDGDEIIFKAADMNIEMVVDNVLLFLKKSFDEKNITVSLNVNIENYVFADARMLEIVIRNILNNAIKFTNKGGSISILIWQDGKRDRKSVV